MQATELPHALAGDTLRHAAHDLPSGLYRILIPRGANLWRVGVQTYRYPEPARAVLRMDAPPEGDGVLLDDPRRTLPRLWAGETLRSESPPESGTLSISSGEAGDPFVADRDRWLYLRLDFPAGRTLGWQSQVTLRDVPAPPPAPDPLESRALALVRQAGLVEPLMRLSAATSERDFLQRVKDTGTWAALMRLVALLEVGA